MTIALDTKAGKQTFMTTYSIEALAVICNHATKRGHFYQNLLENKILQKFYIKGVTCCHGNHVFDTMFTQILTFSIFFSIN